ncbi:MAG: DUF2284 domain-containing protein [Defluviitaleaceae bacterium]|nr:DUF2284 domain-containing protein [Defluviitaleaceae bacterium]
MDYAKKAIELGADRAARFGIGDVAFDERVVLKCVFGCASYGMMHTCPNQKSPLSMQDYERILKRYEWGIIIGCADKKTSQEVSFEIERACFYDGYYFAFSLSDCGLCETGGTGSNDASCGCALALCKPCRNPVKARPAFHSVGVDVFKTVRRLGMPIGVLKDEFERQNWYSAVFVE